MYSILIANYFYFNLFVFYLVKDLSDDNWIPPLLFFFTVKNKIQNNQITNTPTPPIIHFVYLPSPLSLKMLGKRMSLMSNLDLLIAFCER